MVIFYILSNLLLISNIFFLKNTILGFIFLIIWLVVNSFGFNLILNKYFKALNFKQVFSFFLSFFILCFFGSIFTVFYKINLIFLIISIILTSIISFIGLLFFRENKLLLKYHTKILEFIKNKYCTLKIFIKDSDLLNKNFFIIIIGILICGFWIIYYFSKARFYIYDIYLWDNIFKHIVFPILGIMFLSLVFIFKYKKVVPSLIIIIFTSFIIHSYLPILYENGFGGDRFRHLATEKFLQEGNISTPSLFGAKENITLKKIGIVEVPEVLIVGNKQSYANKWTADIFLSWILNKDVFIIDKYLIYIIWSFLIPILFFNLIKNFTEKNEYKLLFSISSLFLSPLQIYGSIGQPLSFGIMLFLVVLSLGINSSLNNRKEKIIFFIVSLIMLYFNYILFFIIYLLLVLFYFIDILLKKTKNKFINILNMCLLGFGCFYLIFFDIASKQTFFIKQSFIEFISKFFTFITNIIALKESYQRIDSGQTNFIYFKINNFIQGLEMSWLVNLAPFLCCIIFILLIIGVLNFIKIKKGKYIVFVFLSLFLGYILSFSLLYGVNIFNKRSEILISIFILFFIIFAVEFVYHIIPWKNIKNIFIGFMILFFSLLSTSTLVSGPIMENITRGDLDSTKWLTDKLKGQDRVCVIGNTWPLLALEYNSSKQIVGGGFPVGLEFSQTERVEIFNEIVKNPSKEVLNRAKEVTGAKECYLLLKNKYIKDLGFKDPYKKYKEILQVFKYNLDFEDTKIFIEK